MQGLPSSHQIQILSLSSDGVYIGIPVVIKLPYQPLHGHFHSCHKFEDLQLAVFDFYMQYIAAFIINVFNTV
jgi:hypothetical protein